MTEFTTSKMTPIRDPSDPDCTDLERTVHEHLAKLPIIAASSTNAPSAFQKRVKLLEAPEQTSWEMRVVSMAAWATRYRNWDQNTGISEESIPEETFVRVAEALAWVEQDLDPSLTTEDVRQYAKDFYRVMVEKEFLPAGRTLANAGTKRKVVSNCVVLEFDDRLFKGSSSILNTMIEAVKLQCQGCGLGFAWHLLRPYGSDVITGQTQAAGIVSYMNLYATMFSTVKQSNSRNGANMGMCLIDHPEVLDFIRAKDTEGDCKVVFNITVLFTDEFLKQATDPKHPEFHRPWVGRYEMPIRNADGYGTKVAEDGEETMQEIRERPFFRVRTTDLFKDKAGRPTTTWGPEALDRDGGLNVNDKYYPNWTAARILEHVCLHAWRNGEPGFGFYDEIQRTNPLPGLGNIEASNPCGEQFLHDGDVCNLGSINCNAFVRFRRQYADKPRNAYFDWDRLREVTRTAMRMLDNVIEITEFESDRVQKRIMENRRVGLGVMGLADALLSMRIPYDSDKARKFSKKMMAFITKEAEEMSREMGKNRGSFPNIHLSVFFDKSEETTMRNAACTTIAPTGTISAFAGVCNGCEPRFCPAYSYRHVLKLDEQRYRWVEEAMRECCRKSDRPEMQAMAEEIDFKLVVGPHSEFVKWMGELGINVHRPLASLAKQLIDDEEALEEFMLSITQKDSDVDGGMSLYDAITCTGQMKAFEPLIPDDVMRVFQGAMDITPEGHVKMQAALQKRTNNSISKTINLPESATVSDVRDIIVLAWKSGLKGCTVYRDNSRTMQVLNKGTSLDEDESLPHPPTNHVRLQDLTEHASEDEYRTLFHGAADQMISVEMTPEELRIALRAVISSRGKTALKSAQSVYEQQLSALEKGIGGLALSTSDEDNEEASSSSLSGPQVSTPPIRAKSLLGMSDDGTQMCTRNGCGKE